MMMMMMMMILHNLCGYQCWPKTKYFQFHSRPAEKPTCKSRSNASQSDPWSTKTTFLVMKTNTHICPVEIEIKMNSTQRLTAKSSAEDATLSAVQMDMKHNCPYLHLFLIQTLCIRIIFDNRLFPVALYQKKDIGPTDY